VAVGPGDLGAPAVAGGAAAEGIAATGGDGAAGDPVPSPAVAAGRAPSDPADASLLALVDRLTAILEHSDLGELEVAAGATTIILRSPSALERRAPEAGAPALEAGTHPAEAAATAPAPAAATPAHGAAAPAKPAVRAPLTGIFYPAPSPGATPYVSVGDHVSVGQIIGLIEAMKLFNEIKSDLAGRVVRICADSGALVKTRQPLIEVEPA
jgi:acetyl-CoA carboxylase biotin carboxyl carrier protein